MLYNLVQRHHSQSKRVSCRPILLERFFFRFDCRRNYQSPIGALVSRPPPNSPPLPSSKGKPPLSFMILPISQNATPQKTLLYLLRTGIINNHNEKIPHTTWRKIVTFTLIMPWSVVVNICTLSSIDSGEEDFPCLCCQNNNSRHAPSPNNLYVFILLRYSKKLM